MRLTTKARIRALELWKIGKRLVNRRHPVLAHIIPILGAPTPASLIV